MLDGGRRGPEGERGCAGGGCTCVALRPQQPAAARPPQVEFISEDECAFLYDEIFVRQEYMQHGISLTPGGGDILDVGANIGLFALYCHRVLNPQGTEDGEGEVASACTRVADRKEEEVGCRIFAFEPVPRIFRVLCRNLEGLPGMNPRAYGLAAQVTPEADFLFFEDCPGESTRRIQEGQDQRARINPDASAGVQCVGELRVLSDVMREEGITSVQLLKIDVEGDELDVLMGLQDADWRKVQQVAVEVHDIDFRLSRIQALLQRHGFWVHTQQQTTKWHMDMLVCVPKDLNLHYVYASRQCSK
eukprot:Tamp_16338.p1 GENE.Tamp_16338~~Tamp_16338.p1  ORF type:complete len:304 (+),score=54.31 Tamp_16338:434-1345(+)